MALSPEEGGTHTVAGCLCQQGTACETFMILSNGCDTFCGSNEATALGADLSFDQEEVLSAMHRQTHDVNREMSKR